MYYYYYYFIFLFGQLLYIGVVIWVVCRSQGPRRLKRGSAAACLLAEFVGSNPAGGMGICVAGKCCVLSSRSLFVGLITRPDESCQLWRVQ